MICPWKTAQDIQRYMCHCILRYDGHPYHVIYGNAAKLFLYKITDQGRVKLIHTVNPEDPLLDVESPDLGYFNQDGHTFRVERQPYKQFSQGLTDKNTCVYDVEGTQRPEITIFCQGVEDMIVGKYPSFEECWDIVKDGGSVAASRDVAVSRSNKDFPAMVYYKGDIVGYINPGSMKVIVPSSDRGWIVSRYLSQFTWEIE